MNDIQGVLILLAIKNAQRIDDNFAVLEFTDFGRNPPGQGEISQTGNRVEHCLHQRSGSGGVLQGDVLCNIVQFGQCSVCPLDNRHRLHLLIKPVGHFLACFFIR